MSELPPSNNNEQMRDPRLERLFAPIMPPGSESIYEVNARQYNRFVNEQTKREAAERLSVARQELPGIGDMLDGHLPGAKAEDQVTAMREQADVRYEVGQFLLDQLDQRLQDPASSDQFTWPERIVSNRQKVPNDRLINPPNNMTSREYVAVLALAMLDGSYNSARAAMSRHDGIEQNQYNQVVQGQHRAAALQLLGLWQQ